MSKPGCGLYLITPARIADLDAFESEAKAALGAGGVEALQVRLKDVEDAAIGDVVMRLRPLCRAGGVSLILNDRPDLAASLDCDGVHVGQGDTPLDEARRRVGPDRVVGVTCHDSRHLAMEAAEGGADYVAFGAFYPTATKQTVHRPDPEILEIWQETMLIPCVAIGGITPGNAEPLVAAGADFLAVSNAVWSAPEGAAAVVRAFAAPIARGLALRKG